MNIQGRNIGINNAELNINSSALINSLSNKKTDEFKNVQRTTNPMKANVTPVANGFLCSPNFLLNVYLENKYSDFLIKKAPEIKNKLANYGYELKVIPNNVKKIEKSHLQTTTAWAMQLATAMKIPSYERKILEQACVFHDFGKSVIPDEILNKPGKLTKEEKEVMDLHAEFGYKLLKNTPINKRVLEIIKNHHKPHTNESDILQDILSVADIYSALREERVYKTALSNKDALDILHQKADSGEVSTEVVNALEYLLTANNAKA